MTPGEAVIGKGLLYIGIGLMALIVVAYRYREVAYRYREAARTWLDRRFFRKAHDARKALFSSAGRVRVETGPGDPASVATDRAEDALHRKMAAFIGDNYRIEQLLGRGGMGAVYRARDVRLDRLVALKIVRPGLIGDSGTRQRFMRDAQIVAGLQHPSIVSVFDYGTFPDGGGYLVMELVRGEDLRHALQREGQLEPKRALRILTAVCGAIEVAHRQGVLHQDLKPENILLPDGGGEAKVLDFGVVNVVPDAPGGPEPIASEPFLITAAGMIIGTPAYMAPEQLRGLPLDARCDIFSLGVVAFEMLTGELPFGRGSLADIVLAHARGVPAFRPGTGLPADLEHAVRTALDPDPDRRPPTAHAFAQLLAA